MSSVLSREALVIAPRGLSREHAATYCGVTPRGFDNWVKLGIVPGPIAGTHRYDRKALDAALDRLSGLAPTPSNPAPESSDEVGGTQDDVRQRYLEWKRRRDEKRA